MTETYAELQAALDRVLAAARAHLDAVLAAEGARDDDAVWQAYVTLNNASHEYDEALNDACGEVTPWDLEAISPEQAQGGQAGGAYLERDEDGGHPDDPYPSVVSVRQRRDYRVPSVSALLELAELGRGSAADGETLEPITKVAEAIVELLQAGDSSLGMLDIDELEPLDGIVMVVDVETELDVAAGEEAFRIGAADRVVGRLDERTVEDEA